MPRLDQRDRQGLLVIVAQDQRGDVVGHGASRLVALLAVSSPSRDGIERDLDVDLVVGAVDAGRVVDRVGVDPHAARARPRSAPRWVKPRLPPSPITCAQISPPRPGSRRWRGRRHSAVGLGRALHVGADAAEPEQVDRRQQDRVSVTRCGVPLLPAGQARTCACGAERDRLGATAKRRRRPRRSAPCRSPASSNAAARTGARARRSSSPGRDRDR